MIIERHFRDLGGLFFITLSLLIILGFTGLSKGFLITSLTDHLKQWLGWGSLIIPGFLLFFGLMLLSRTMASRIHWNHSKSILLEVLFFSLLCLISIINNIDLIRAERGFDGGIIGWGLAKGLTFIIPPTLLIILLIIMMLLSIIELFGLKIMITKGFSAWLLSGNYHQNINKGIVEVSQLKSDTDEDRSDIPELLQLESNAEKIKNNLPPLNILAQEHPENPDEADIHATAGLIETTLYEFGVPSHVVGFRVGPTVTQFAIEPGFIEKTGPDGELIQQKIRVAQISSLSRDLALALSAERLRIEAPVPGHAFVGIEVPNRQLSLVRLRGLLETDAFKEFSAPLGLTLGRKVSGQPLLADLGRMPHLLIAGTTGSGKSVCISALTVCLVMNNSPDDLRLVMLDPKMVELVRFNGLPHLLGNVETDLDRMLGVLRWALVEMDERYRLLESSRSRDIETYNDKAKKRNQKTIPYIVIMVDELADLMMQATDQTEHCLVRLAQMARATGIHLVVATQRPSTDVVTGVIKANFPARLAFTVASSVDSRVILDSNGAESLLGRGDLLFLDPDIGSLQRAQGVIVTDHEVEGVVNFWKKIYQEPMNDIPPWEDIIKEGEQDGDDQLIRQAIDIVRSSRRASASYLQRRLRIGYPRAARLIDELETMGVVGPAQGAGREREVIWSIDDVNPGEETADDEAI